MEFEWEPRKALRNLYKHEVSFEEAARVFLDPNRIETSMKVITARIGGEP